MAQIVATLTDLLPKIASLEGTAADVSVRDAAAHLKRLAYPGFVAGVGTDRMNDVARYLAAIEHRLASVVDNPARDLRDAASCVEVESLHRELVDRLGLTQELEAVTWDLEELRVVTFAQHLKGPAKISATRVRRRLDEIARRS